LSLTGVAVEKLTHQKMPEKTLQWETLPTAFSVFLDIFYPPNFGFLKKMDFFNSHRQFHVLTAGQ
jgi:hypothetical protein